MSARKQIIRHPDMPPPYGAYSPVVRAGGFLFLAGIAGIDPETGEAPADFEAQARQAFANLAATLACADASLADVVRCTTYLADANEGPVLNELFAEAFAIDPPARSTPLVSLPRGLLLSLEATVLAPA